MTTVLIPKVPRTTEADPVVTPQSATPHPVPETHDAVSPQSNGLALIAMSVGIVTVLLAIFTTMTWLVGALAVAGMILGVGAILRFRVAGSGIVSAVLAVILSIGSIGLITFFGPATGALAHPDAGAASSHSKAVEVTFGTVTPDAASATTSVEVTVRNTTGAPVSTWASLTAVDGTGATLATQGVGVKDLQPGAESTQTVVFNAELPKNVTFTVDAVL